MTRITVNFLLYLYNMNNKKKRRWLIMKKIDLKQKWKVIEKLFNNMEEDHISEYSAQCAYYTILSFIPFIILLLTMIQYTSLSQQEILDAISRLVPISMNEFVLGLVREVYSKSLGTVSISIIFTLWSAGKGLFALTKGLHSVYNVNNEDKINIIYLRIKVLIETILFIMLIAIGLAILVFGKSMISIAQEHFGEFKNFNIVSEIITEIVFIIITFVVFLILYKYMQKRKVTFKSQMYGAIFGAFALNIISFVFSKYLVIFKGFSITYGSLTTLMLIMMWTYSCFYTVFLGAELNKIVNNVKLSQKKE